MSHWDYVTVAYALALGSTALLTIWAWRAMVRAEKEARR